MINDWSYLPFEYWVGVARELGLEPLLAAFPNFSDHERVLIAERLNEKPA